MIRMTFSGKKHRPARGLTADATVGVLARRYKRSALGYARLIGSPGETSQYAVTVTDRAGAILFRGFGYVREV